ncbi:MAG: hypothetical protein COV29_00475 [Candidatus Yanofskybacteria bacterium CG10_big_fil_rev_8_21_14_0_10_36_16]|uniref:Tetratricopeptide repeat-like domain-containing protein n=1 Tax=Candidatus Yanofskybacteria bacterium CG10_big_fil_rev_8_21_14_0_10_36_16 TaxID=1975096 RepID=A0A2J0Q8B6_9BACT|nr:MAG: hypothetical protein COV29_00475 [Candidatus Yanofskybacteria bacterium CG10_big_fil_rev_8_21_14_0_10_36_16]
MKVLTAFILLSLAIVPAYYGILHNEYNEVMKSSNTNFELKKYNVATDSIDKVRNSWVYWPINKMPFLDILGIDEYLDYQRGRIKAELGEYDDAMATLNNCAESNNNVLAGNCLYLLANIALYRGNVNTAEKRWKEAQEKYPGGHDYDTQVNLELLQSQKKKAQAMAAKAGAVLSHRRNNNPNTLVQPGAGKDKTIKP